LAAAVGAESPKQPALEPLPAVVHVSMPTTVAAAKVWVKLGQPIPIQFPDETPLEDVLKYIKAATQGADNNGIPIYVDPAGLQEAEKTMQSPVTLDLDGLPLATTLSLLLKQIGLTYYVQKDGLLVITSESGQSTVLSDPLPTLLDHLVKLRSEVAALRAEVSTLRGGGPLGGRNASGMSGPDVHPSNGNGMM
jgi:hypothetical protein